MKAEIFRFIWKSSKYIRSSTANYDIKFTPLLVNITTKIYSFHINISNVQVNIYVSEIFTTRVNVHIN